MSALINPIFDTETLLQDLDTVLEHGAKNGPADIDESRAISILQDKGIVPDEFGGLAVPTNELEEKLLANKRARKALADTGASIENCAEVLSFIINDPNVKVETKRRAVLDALTIHHAVPKVGADNSGANFINVTVERSPHVNLDNLLCPNPVIIQQEK